MANSMIGENQMNMKNLSNEDLLNETKQKVTRERQLTLEILHLLRETEKRRFHLELGFGSLFDFCVRELRYTEAAASRRIAAMRLLGEIPEAERKIQSGELSLSNVAQAQRFFQAENKMAGKAYSPQEKREVLKSLEKKSARDAQKELIKISPVSALPKERERILSVDRIEVKFSMGHGLQAKIEKLKSLLSHKIQTTSYEELFGELADIALAKLDPAEKLRVHSLQSLRNAAATSRSKELQDGQATPTKERTSKYVPVRKYLPVALRKEIWKRDQGQCSYQNPISGQTCGSQFKLEIDHITPKVHGGADTTENLRLLCSSHNKLEAIRKIGPGVMQMYLKL
jgi:5-methylcytosine-specific restriction endonuclease McrA